MIVLYRTDVSPLVPTGDGRAGSEVRNHTVHVAAKGGVLSEHHSLHTPHLLLQEQAGQLLLQVMLSHSLQKMWQHTGDQAAALLWQMHSGAA